MLSYNLLKGRDFVLITPVFCSSWRVPKKYGICIVGKCRKRAKEPHLPGVVTYNKSRNRLGPDFECQTEFRFYAKVIITIHPQDYLDEMYRMV